MKKTVNYTILVGSYLWGIALEGFKPHCDNFPNCQDCETNIRLNEWYNSKAKKEADELGIKLPNRKYLLSKIHRQAFYTTHFILERLNSSNTKNWFYDIKKYIVLSLESFGECTPKGCSPTRCLGWLPYIDLVSVRLEISMRAENEAEQKQLDRIKSYIKGITHPKPPQEDDTDLDTLFDTFNKWIEAFPFEWEILDDYKSKFPKQIRLFKNVIPIPYSSIAHIEPLTKDDLIKFLVKKTNDLIDEIDFYDLVKRRIITNSNIKEKEFDLWRKQSKLRNDLAIAKYDSCELEYADILNEWLSNAKKDFEYFKKEYLVQATTEIEADDEQTLIKKIAFFRKERTITSDTGKRFELNIRIDEMESQLAALRKEQQNK